MIKQGDKVMWFSQAGGNYTDKTGTVIAVLRKEVDYYGGENLPQKLMVPLFKDRYNCTVKEAKDLYEGSNTFAREWALQSAYRLKFDIRNLGPKDTTHYLVEVEEKGAKKKKLYHPNPDALTVL